MRDGICIVCQSPFQYFRGAKLTCSLECRQIRHCTTSRLRRAALPVEQKRAEKRRYYWKHKDEIAAADKKWRKEKMLNDPQWREKERIRSLARNRKARAAVKALVELGINF